MELASACLLLFDADNFKQINDTYGHEEGDRVLKRVADAIRRHFRWDDGICRLGGDEFVVFMTHSSEEQQTLIISRIQQINAELEREAEGTPPISVSVGIAFGGSANDPAVLFEHADRALYQTKDRGKRGYTFYDDGSAA